MDSESAGIGDGIHRIRRIVNSCIFVFFWEINKKNMFKGDKRMRMRKINDWFVAGLIAGVIGGIAHLIWNAMFLLFGIKYHTFWHEMSGLFYTKQLVHNSFTQLHGILDAIGLSAMNGVLVSLVLILTGKDYLYTKSVALNALGAYFIFIFILPISHLEKNSLIQPWIAIGGFVIGNGLFTAYALKRIFSFDTAPKNEDASGSPIKLRRFFILPEPAKKRANKVQFVKPKKL